MIDVAAPVPDDRPAGRDDAWRLQEARRRARRGRARGGLAPGLRPALMKHGDGVAIRHTYNLAVEGIGPSAGLPTTEKKERNSNSSGELDVEIG